MNMKFFAVCICMLVWLDAYAITPRQAFVNERIAKEANLSFVSQAITKSGMESYFGGYPHITIFAPMDSACGPEIRHAVLASPRAARAFLEAHMVRSAVTIQNAFLTRSPVDVSGQEPLRLIAVDAKRQLQSVTEGKSFALKSLGGRDIKLGINRNKAVVGDGAPFVASDTILVPGINSDSDAVVQKIMVCAERL